MYPISWTGLVTPTSIIRVRLWLVQFARFHRFQCNTDSVDIANKRKKFGSKSLDPWVTREFGEHFL